MLTKLYNNQAEQYRLLAVERGKDAVELSGDPDAVSELANAWGSYIPDWCVRNHHALIEWFSDFLPPSPGQPGRAHVAAGQSDRRPPARRGP